MELKFEELLLTVPYTARSIFIAFKEHGWSHIDANGRNILMFYLKFATPVDLDISQALLQAGNSV